ncbi:MAG: arylsulfatase [Pseudomonadota bacterium]|uniref:arylsulfatase n=1 Tax=Sphingobium naphthae TaxID=1886786 RepID=UPI002B09CD2D|nr:arylsulfatase [Pseudomonadota bacterium]
MHHRFRPILSLAAALLGAAPPGAVAAAERERPNFLIIVADDLGYSDLGAFGGEIATPNLDAIANGGTKLTGFHTAPTCSPTRSMLLTGTDNHKAGLGSMAELLAPNQKGKPGHEGYLRGDVASLAELLGAGGYRTLFSGKWHLGLAPSQDPHLRGFQHSFALLQGGHNHFGKNLSADPAKGFTYTRDGKVLEGLPANFYSSDYFAGQLIDQLKDSAKAEGGKKPFFAYLAFTAPHWPLQAPREDIARYKGRYDAGFDVLRAQRLERQAQLGLIDPAVVAHVPILKNGSWDSLTAQEKRSAARDMEIYAAMVDRMDQNVGRVIDALKRSGDYDNTVILFLADNGAEGMDVEKGSLPQIRQAVQNADNSLDNRGNASSYIGIGPGWAQAATAPSWLYKAYATEGGTHTVAFTGYKGFTRKGVAPAFTHVTDVVPTLLDLAHVPQPGTRFQGRAVTPIRGKSWVPYLTHSASLVHAGNEPIGTELFGSRSLRLGDWKIMDLGDGVWRLFDVARDPGETQDLSLVEAERKEKLIGAWEAYARDVGVILPDKQLYRP